MPTQPQRESHPVHDQSMSSDSILREVHNLRELIFARLNAMNEAVTLLADTAARSPTAKEVSVHADQSFKTVTELHKADFIRIDSEMVAERRRIDEQMTLRADYSKQLDEAESKRIDAIRAVDVAAVAVASERATQQASVLANQVVASAETLRALVASTAATVAQQLSQLSTQLSDRLSSLEKSQYENKGSGNGMEKMWGWMFGAGMLIVAIAGVAFATLHK